MSTSLSVVSAGQKHWAGEKRWRLGQTPILDRGRCCCCHWGLHGFLGQSTLLPDMLFGPATIQKERIYHLTISAYCLKIRVNLHQQPYFYISWVLFLIFEVLRTLSSQQKLPIWGPFVQNDFLANSPSRSYGVMVSTLDFESSDPSSNLGRTLMFWSPSQLNIYWSRPIGHKWSHVFL